MLQLCFLGEQRVSVPGEAARPSLVVGRALELLAYLVVNSGAPQERERLAGLLWPESSDGQARTNLRRELHGLRRVPGLDAHIEPLGTALRWRDGPGCTADVMCFCRNVTLARETASGRGDAVAALRHGQAALDSYTGDLLPGLYGEWVLAGRDILHRMCVEMCDIVADAAAGGNPGQAIAAAQRRIQLEPLEEAGYQRLMELASAAGDAAAAVRCYHRCAAVLENELGVEPGPRTRELARELLGFTPARRPSGGRAVMVLDPGPGAGHPLGRHREQEVLRARWHMAARGQPGLVLVTGDPGIGKTRLIVSLYASAKSQGAATAYARCFAGVGRVALSPVTDWLASSDFAATRHAETSREARSDGAILPAARNDWQGPGAGVSDARQRRAFLEALVRGVLAPARPTLLVLDDLQWCDAETLEWLALLFSQAPSAPLLIAAAARPEELAATPALAPAMRALNSGHWLQELAVSPLDAASSAELAASVLEEALSGADAELLHAATGGYPLHIVEAARGMRRAQGGSVPLAEVLGDSGDGAGVLRHRFAQCSEHARNVAQLAAAVGREFSLGLLASAWEGDEASLVRGVDELWRRRILREQRGGYDFSHDLLRQCAYELATPPQRWLLHRRLAEAMEARHPGARDAVAAELAGQYKYAGDPEKAADYFVQAGDAATRIFANAQAVADYQCGLDLLGDFAAGADTREAELGMLLRMPPPLTALQGYSAPQLRAVLERLVELSGQLGRNRVLAQALIGLFAATFVQGQTKLSHTLATRALGLARHMPELLGQANFAVAGAASCRGRTREAIRHFELACAQAPDEHSYILGTRIDVHARAWSAHAHWLSGDGEAAFGLADEAVDRATSADHPYSLAVALAYRAVLLQFSLGSPGMHDGGRDRLAADAAAVEALCARHNFAYYGQWGAVLRGWLQGGSRGTAVIDAALGELRSAHALARTPYWQCLLAETLSGSGRDTDARAVLAAAESFAHRHEDLWWLPEVLRQRALLADPPAARVLLERSLSLAAEQHNPWPAAAHRAAAGAAVQSAP